MKTCPRKGVRRHGPTLLGFPARCSTSRRSITLLFLLAWWRKRRMARGIRERFEREEHWDAEFRGELPLSELGPVDEIGEGSDEEEEWRR